MNQGSDNYSSHTGPSSQNRQTSQPFIAVFLLWCRMKLWKMTASSPLKWMGRKQSKSTFHISACLKLSVRCQGVKTPPSLRFRSKGIPLSSSPSPFVFSSVSSVYNRFCSKDLLLYGAQHYTMGHHYCYCVRPPPTPLLYQTNPVHTTTVYLSNIHRNITTRLSLVLLRGLFRSGFRK